MRPRPHAGWLRDAGAAVELGGDDTTCVAQQHPRIPSTFTRMQHGAEHLHRCGPRAVAEFLLELARDLAAEPAILAKLQAWRSLDPAMVRAVTDAWCGGRDFPPTLTRVPRR